MHAEVNKPGHIAHGLNGPVVAVDGNTYTLDIDGIHIDFDVHELLFIRFRPMPEPRIDYWLRAFFFFVLGVAFGVIVSQFQLPSDGSDGIPESERALHEGDPL